MPDVDNRAENARSARVVTRSTSTVSTASFACRRAKATDSRVVSPATARAELKVNAGLARNEIVLSVLISHARM